MFIIHRSIDGRWSRFSVRGVDQFYVSSAKAQDLRKLIGGSGFAVALSLLVLFQWLGGAPVSAEWMLVDANAKATVYIDTESITRNGNLVNVWVLDDLRTAHTRGFSKYFSSRAQEEHDCTNERFRVLAVENFMGRMGTGDVVYRHASESNWTSIPQGTLAQSVWKFVCGKK